MKHAKYLILTGTFVMFVVQGAFGAQSPQMPLAGSAIPQFMQPLPLLKLPGAPGSGINTVLGNTPLKIKMCEFQANVLPAGTVPGYTGTWVWGYLVDPDPAGLSTCAQLVDMYKNPATGIIDTSIGPVIVNQRGGPSTDVTWVNDLGSAAATQVLAYKYSTDQTLHWADPLGLNCMMTLMGMYPMFGDPCAQNYDGPIPAVVHLHGGEVPAEIDGSPDSWFTSTGILGPKYYSFGAGGSSAVYRYPNTQEAAPLWFHDHTLGATRLNVYAGMAGGYYLYDPAQNLPSNLQPLTEVVPIVIQDRMFDINGQLFFQADSAGGILWATNPEHPYWSPEFVGDAIMVNGKTWPYLNVEPKRYRFLFLNGSNARTYEMFLVDPVTKVMGPPIWVIGTDGGYLDAPVMLDPNLGQRLVMMPGERYEAIIDFAGLAPGTQLIIRNTGRTPFPKGAPPAGSTLGRIMQFRITACTSGLCGPADPGYDPAGGSPLRTVVAGVDQRIVRLADPAAGALAPGVIANKTRQLTLNEVMGMPMTVIDPVTGFLTAYPGGPLEILLNNTKWDGTLSPNIGNRFLNGITETPREGDTEVWEIVNITADAHPIHLHLVQFQLINRQNFNVNNYNGAYNMAFGTGPVPLPMGCTPGMFCPAYGPPLDYITGNPRALGGNPDITMYLQGAAKPPLPNEAGWKDTVIMYPGQVTRIAVRYAPTDVAINAADMLFYPFDPGGDGFQYNYVWHCHIIDHEDNEMMRPSAVVPVPGVIRTVVKGTNY